MNRMNWILLALTLCCACVCRAQRLAINGAWDFQRVTDATATGAVRNQGSDWSSQYDVQHVSESGVLALSPDTVAAEMRALMAGEWERVALPHTPRIEPLTVVHQWQGVCYYRRRLSVTPQEAGGQLWLEFEGAMHLADLWVNGQHVARHAGGYTPFVVDVTGLLKAGDDNELLVRLDNRDNSLIPPGKPLGSLDFCYYGGLYRDVALIAKPSTYITHPILSGREAGGGIFVTYPEVSGRHATVRIRTELANADAADHHVSLRHTLYTWSRGKGRGKRVARKEAQVQLPRKGRTEVGAELSLENPRLWSPDAPQLYLLVSEVVRDGRVVDSEQQRIGIRRFEMSREHGLLVNGEPVKLVGSNRHMEYPYVGNAISDAAQYRDIYQIRENGFNVVRLGHYPQDPSVLEACDELGLLAIEPIPGWQFYNGDSVFVGLTHRDIRDLIRRDRNHPCILLWETTLNESWPPKEWKDEAVRIAHSEMPGDQCFTSGDAYGYDGFDVCYNDWEEGFNRPNRTAKPGFIREYYDYEFGGHYSTTRVRRGDGERALVQNAWNAQWSLNRYSTYYPATMGGAVWSMYDYNRGCCDNICYSGVADLFRLPKFSLHFYRSQVAAGTPLPSGPMPYELYVATWRAAPFADTVQVYGNVEEVELWLNGRRLSRQRADDGPDTDYVARPDGGNARHLASPPFTFTRVPAEAGTLRAVGFMDGKAVATYEVRTPGRPARVELSYFESGRPAEQSDLLIVYARLTDAQGAPCRDNGVRVRLTAEGGTVTGPAEVETEAGVASFLVRTDDRRRLKLHGAAGSLSGRLTLKLKPARGL